MRQRFRRVATWTVGVLVVLAVAIQLVPYGRDHVAPPVTGEPAWDSPRTRELAVRACFDCHSNETRYPWYASIAPFSWVVTSHVLEAREELNFSTFATSPGDEAGEAAETVREGEMPPGYYTLLHPEARLTDEERRALAAGLAATIPEEEETVGAAE